MGSYLTEKRIEELECFQKSLRELDNSVQEIIDGKSSLSKFAERHGLTPQTLNSTMNLGHAALLRRLKIANDDYLLDLLKYSLSPTERLIRVIFGSNELIILDTAEEEKIINIMEKVLTERQYRVIKLRFGFEDGECKTLEEVGKMFKLTRDRIRQIEATALRKIRQPKYLKTLLPNYELRIKALQEVQYMKNLDDKLKADEEAAKSRVTNFDLLKASIDELELSVRSYNCLKRAGIDTIRQLSERSIEDLKKVRNLGKHSLQEITDKLKGVGIVLPETNDVDFIDNKEEFNNTKIDNRSINKLKIASSIRTKLMLNGIDTIDQLFEITIYDLSKFLNDQEIQLIIRSVDSQFKFKFADDYIYWSKYEYKYDKEYIKFNENTPILFKRDYILGVLIDVLDLSLPIYVSLSNVGITTIRELTINALRLSKLTNLESIDLKFIQDAMIKRYGGTLDIQ